MNSVINSYSYFPLGIIKGDIESIRSDLLSLYSQYNIRDKWKVFEAKVKIKNIASPPHITKGGAHLPKYVIWKPAISEEWIAFFTNYEDGLFTTQYNLAKKFNRTILYVAFSNREFSSFPAYKFMYYNGEEEERIVSLIKEERKWEFFQSGELLFFEDENLYNEKDKQKRINNEIILDYCKQFGVIINDDFFSSNFNALYFERLIW